MTNLLHYGFNYHNDPFAVNGLEQKMKIESITLHNFRAARNVQLELSSHVNVLAGINGAGKSTILDALAISLSWLVNRIQRPGNSGRPIPEGSITNGQHESFLEVQAKEGRCTYAWTLARTALGRSGETKSSLDGASSLADHFRTLYAQSSTLPVVAYYTVNRVVGSTAPDLPDRENVYTLDVYENALGGRANYQSFFEWFRVQDDLINEKLGSKDVWLLKNRAWSQKQVKKLFHSFSTYLSSMYPEKKHIWLERFTLYHKDPHLWQNPRYFFHEIVDLLHNVEVEVPRNVTLIRMFHDFEYLVFKFSEMHELSEQSQIEKTLSNLLHHVLLTMRELELQEHSSQLAQFVWEMLGFVTQLSLWWMSDEGKRAVTRIFAQRDASIRSKSLNWKKLDEEVINSVQDVISLEMARKRGESKGEGRELFFVRKAIESFVPEYANLRVKRAPRPHMLIDKNEVTLNLDQLSDGEKNLIALVGDIARRLSIANPTLEDPLLGEGIILIDEVDLHLHPQWQRLVVNGLSKTFQNCQFIITTHSPQVLGEVEAKNVRLLYSDFKQGLSYWQPTQSFGLSTNDIIDELMKPDDRILTLTRNEEVDKEITSVFRLIDESAFGKARKKLDALKKKIRGTSPEIVRAESLLVMLDADVKEVE